MNQNINESFELIDQLIHDVLALKILPNVEVITVINDLMRSEVNGERFDFILEGVIAECMALLTLLAYLREHLIDRFCDSDLQLYFKRYSRDILNRWLEHVINRSRAHNKSRLISISLRTDHNQISNLITCKIIDEIPNDLSRNDVVLIDSDLESLHKLSYRDNFDLIRDQSNDKTCLIFHYDAKFYSQDLVNKISWEAVDLITATSEFDLKNLINANPFILRFVKRLIVLDPRQITLIQQLKAASTSRASLFERALHLCTEIVDVRERGTLDSPNLFFVGPGKAGTTSIFHYLNNHSAVYTSEVKEFNYFPVKYDRSHYSPVNPLTLKSYLKYFNSTGSFRYRVDASPSHIDYFATSPLLIKLLSVDARIVITLRNPFEASYSAYKMMIREGREERPFNDIFLSNEKRNPYLSSRLYARLHAGVRSPSVQAFIQMFQANPPHIIIYDEFAADNNKALRQLQSYLGLNIEEINDGIIYHVDPSRVSRSSQKSDDRMSTFQAKKSDMVTIQPKWYDDPNNRKAYDIVCEVWANDILKLSKLIDKDLSNWIP